MNAMTTLAAMRPDHLVVMAESLQAGVRWCEATLGVTPGAGGEHPLMGTHNRLFRIGSAPYPDVFFEKMPLGVDQERHRGREAAVDDHYAAEGRCHQQAEINVPALLSGFARQEGSPDKAKTPVQQIQNAGHKRNE